MLSKIGTDGYYDLLHITFNDKNEVLLNGDTVNFNAINSCYNRYTVADVKYFFDNKHLAVSFKDKSNSENGLTMVINVCESGICEIKELPYEGYFIKNEKNYQATWDIKIIQGKTFFYWQEKNSNKINRAELNYMLNEALFWNYEPLDVSIIEDANTCNNIYQRYQRN